MISIIIPLYNKADIVTKTLESVFGQTHQDFEIVIIDDGSTDNSLTVVQSFTDPRIRIITQANSGVSAARNRGIAEAKYNLIAFLDADDLWDIDYLEVISKLVETYSECDVFASDYRIVDTYGKVKMPVNAELAIFSKSLDGQSGVLKNYFDFASQTAPPLWTSAIVCRKKVIQEVKGFPLRVRMGEDLIVWAKLATQFDIAYSKEIKATYNVKASTELLDHEPLPDEPDFVGQELKKLLVHQHDKVSLKKYISLWHKMRTTMYLANFLRTKALNEALKMLYYNPFKLKNILIFILSLLPHSLRIVISKYVYQNKDKSA